MAQDNIRLNENVLIDAWKRLSVYDRTASHLKNNFVRRRRIVIYLTLTATITSVATAISRAVLGQRDLAVIFALISIVMPLVASYMMNDIVKFTGTTAWIKYRYIAEMMRMHIYLYRMQADIYAVGPPEKMDNLLVEKLSQVRKEVKWDDVIPPSVSEPKTEAEVNEVIREANPDKDDNGLSRISVENYVKWRVDLQKDWYDNRIQEDFVRLKMFFRAGQVVLLIGALVSAIVGTYVNVYIVSLVAITNAISASLSSLSNVSMVGKTYNIFQITSELLKDQKTLWKSLEDDPENKDPATYAKAVSDFVTRIENVLLWERQEWYEMALQAQAAGDKLILGDLTRLTQRAQDAQTNPLPK